MTDTFLAWVLPYRKKGGFVAPQDREWRTMLNNVATKSKVKWVKNGLRHSYATYHVAAYENPVKTSYELGHASADLLFRHYRGLADKDMAQTFWNLRPPATAGNTISSPKEA
jgi:integrase